jgi:hypothetical protein
VYSKSYSWRISQCSPSQTATAIESPARVERAAADEVGGGHEVPESAGGEAKGSPLEPDPADIREDPTATKNEEATARNDGNYESGS